MPAIIGAAAAALAAGTATAGITILGTTFTGLTAGLIAGAASLALSGLSSALTPKPKAPGAGAVEGGSLTRQIRQPISPRRLVYGEMRVSGPYAYIGSTNSNQYLHFVLLLASHEVEEIGEVWINDESIPLDYLDGSGNVTTGKYSSKIRIKKLLGTSAQTADSDLVTEVSEWTSDHRLRGIACIYVRLEYDRDVFSSGIPNVSAWVKGKKVEDTRTSTTYWTHNPTLCLRDFLIDTDLGRGFDSTEIDDTYVDSSANTCEEFVTTTNLSMTVTEIDTSTDIIKLDDEDTLRFQTGDRVNVLSTATLPGGIADESTNYYVIVYQRIGTPRILLASSYENALSGTNIDLTSEGTGTITVQKNAEPRYALSGAIESDEEPHSVIEKMLSSMAGKAIHAGGSWRLKAGSYDTPTIAFDEDDLAGPIIVATKKSRKDRFNYLFGTYVSPLNNGQPSDYPPISNSTYETEDGGRIERPFDLDFTSRPHMAQRLAKISLERSRQEEVFTARFKLTAFKVQAGDNFLMSFDSFGWSSKPFEVLEWSLQVEEEDDGAGGVVGIPYVEMKCQSTASTIYDWNSGEETSVDPAPNSTLPDAFTVSVVAGFSLDSLLVDTQSQDKIFSVKATWDAHPNAFVYEGGLFEIFFKETTETQYNSAGKVDGDINEMILPALKPDVLYDVQIFAYNNIGKPSAATTINNFQVGTSVTTNTEDWENEALARDLDDWETDSLTSEDWET